jgi:radical SAM superfamily enzyme YgiQ (UPF0313 family)
LYVYQLKDIFRRFNLQQKILVPFRALELLAMKFISWLNFLAMKFISWLNFLAMKFISWLNLWIYFMKLERITLLRPNMGNFRSTDGLPPLSMAILAARSPKDVDICFYDDKIEEIPDNDTPDLAAITVETFTARRAYQIAKQYRDRNIPVVMGGYQPTFLPDEALQHADAIVIGDAEGSWERLLADFRKGKLKSRYQGGNERPLNDLVLDRRIFDGKKYPPVVPIQYGRGCRFACDFCSIRAFYQNQHRQRPALQLVEEIKAIGRKKLFFFVDDNLFNSKQSFHELLNLIQPLKIRWSCQISIDVAKDESTLDKMAEAGCVVALIGFESLNNENLVQMGKRWNLVAGDYLSVIKKFHQRGIGIYSTFVFGYDLDTAATIQRTLDFAMEARLEIANFNPLTPTPGSSLYERLKSEGRLLSERWWLEPNYRYGDPIFVPKSMSPDELAQCCFEAKKQFYSWKSIRRRILGSEIGFHWFKTSIIGLANLISRREIYRKQFRVLGA